MTQSELLGVFIEFSVGIGGFSAIAAAFIHQRQAMSAEDIYRILNMLLMALGPAFVALVTLALIHVPAGFHCGEFAASRNRDETPDDRTAPGSYPRGNTGDGGGFCDKRCNSIACVLRGDSEFVYRFVCGAGDNSCSGSRSICSTYCCETNSCETRKGNGMKIGMMLGFEDSIKMITDIAGQAENAGCDVLYTVDAGRSATVTAAAVINATQRVRVGTYIVNAYAREPWMTGIEARDLNEISDGRFVLGVGSGNLHFNDLYMGIDSTRSLAKMREFVEVVRGVVNGKAAQPVRYRGNVHRIRWRASWEPVSERLPVYLSASGPKMVRVAGEVSDGVAIGIMSSVEFVRDIVRPNAIAAAEAVGRDPGEIAFPMATTVSINRDTELARDATRASICKLFHPIPHPYYDSQLRQLGYTDFADQATKLMPAGRLREAMDLVPDEVIDTMTITGTVDECAARIRQ
jgi:alkanesulfonate monooxygenase SsuD/methylene tetrahydromethanopterin reductase-like flavin-dependent oxidoreductase (luciferase family)